MPTEETPLHIQQADGLRALALFIEENPTLADYLKYATNMINAFSNDKAVLAEFLRVGKRYGAEAVKDAMGDKWFYVGLKWGPVQVHVNAVREEVCERVVTGTETVTTTVPDPAKLAEVPQVEVTEVVETVEWVCSPLLAKTPS